MMDLVIRIDGGVQTSNFNEFKEKMLAEIEKANIPLITDDDFAFAEDAVKTFKEAEDAISLAKHNALRDTEDVAKLFEGLDELSGSLRDVRLAMNKKVVAEKAARKQQVIDNARNILDVAIKDVAVDLPEIHKAIRANNADFEGAVSGKRSLEKMQEAVDALLTAELERLAKLKELISENKALIEKCEFPSLFPDSAELVITRTSEVQITIEGRVAKHLLAEKERKEKADEAAKAKKEAEAKAEAELKAESARESAEQPEVKAPTYNPADTVDDKQVTGSQVVSDAKEREPELHKKEEPTGDFVLTMELRCSTNEAKELAAKVNDMFGGYGEVAKIGLARA